MKITYQPQKPKTIGEVCGVSPSFFQALIESERLKNLADQRDIKRRSRKQGCVDPGHNPPMHLYIPPGHIHDHFCPSCGMHFSITAPIIIC